MNLRRLSATVLLALKLALSAYVGLPLPTVVCRCSSQSEQADTLCRYASRCARVKDVETDAIAYEPQGMRLD